MSGSAPRVPGKAGRPHGSKNKISQDLRAVIEAAFHKAGGRDYLVKVAHQRPDVFLALVGKIIPQETRLSVMASYQALPIPVEQREAGPLPPPGAPVAALPMLDDGWLDLAPVEPPTGLQDHVSTAHGHMDNDTLAIEGQAAEVEPD